MRKVVQKKPSSLPPDITAKHVGRALQEWDRSDFTSRAVSFLERWPVEDKNPRVSAFKNWMKHTAERIRGPLTEVCIRHQIPPDEILKTLTSTWCVYLMHRQVDSLIRSQKRRKRAMRILDKAAQIVRLLETADVLNGDCYWATQWACSHGPVKLEGPGSDLEQIGQDLRKLPAQTHRPQEKALRSCALSLLRVFCHHRAKKLFSAPMDQADKSKIAKFRFRMYRPIGELMKAAFSPKIWNPVGNRREAAKKLLLQSQSERIWPAQVVNLSEDIVDGFKHALEQACDFHALIQGPRKQRQKLGLGSRR